VAELAGFWSYVHADDDADGGRVSRLARDVVEQYEMLTGEKIGLFLDRDDIVWGEDWHSKIDESLASIAFFIPVLTPRYFMSAECRRELQYFARRARDLGIEELVLPLLYVDVPSLHSHESPDDLVALVSTFQWEDWRALRFSDVSSSEYRRAVARLAQRLVDANMRAEETNIAAAAVAHELDSSENADDAPGTLDQLVAAEEALPQWETTLGAITPEITSIGQIMEEGTAHIERANAQGKAFAARLTIVRKIARRLREPSENVFSLGNEFASQLHQIDPGFRAIIEQAPSEVRDDPEALSRVCDFFQMIRELSVAAYDALQETQVMIDAISPLEAMSRDLRNPLRRLRQGLTLIVEARDVIDEWVQRIEASGIDCDDLVSSSSPQISDST
jgi:hypothetical protein